MKPVLLLHRAADRVRMELVAYRRAALVPKMLPGCIGMLVMMMLYPVHRMAASAMRGRSAHRMAAAECKEGRTGAEKIVVQADWQLLHPLFHILCTHTGRRRQWWERNLRFVGLPRSRHK